jgi:hypothetical protein
VADRDTAQGKSINAAAWACLLLGICGTLCGYGALADNFGPVRYDVKADELVITMLYRGTNPDHDFSLQWGKCRRLPHGTSEIVAEVLDTQASDAARQDYKKLIRIPLAALNCRPARLTLRTAPRFYYTLPIPARPGR